MRVLWVPPQSLLPEVGIGMEKAEASPESSCALPPVHPNDVAVAACLAPSGGPTPNLGAQSQRQSPAAPGGPRSCWVCLSTSAMGHDRSRQKVVH